MAMTIQELREKRNKAWDTARDFLDSKRNANGVLSEEDSKTYDAMEQTIVDLGKEIQRLERQAEIEAEMNKATSTPVLGKPATPNVTEKTGTASDTYKKAFWNSIRNRNWIDVHDDLHIGTDAEGGYLVPDEFERKLVEALEEEKPDLAICGTGFEEMAERLAGYDIPVLVLQETMADAVAESVTYGSVPESCRGICRYQSMEVILHEVQVMTLTGVGSRRMENVGTGMEVIGVYSPICHEMQMPFSMVLAQKLSTEKKVLYVNLMEHSGMLELLGVPGECDLGEVILALRRQRLTAETLGRGIHETEWMHYVEPFDNPEDLGEMTAGDLQELISFLEKQTSYEILLLDFGQGLRDFLSFLGLCTSIYCPMKSGFYYDCRMDHFRRYLEREPAADIADRMQVIRLPFSAGKIRAGMDVYRQFLWSEFGDYVRNHIGGQEE